MGPLKGEGNAGLTLKPRAAAAAATLCHRLLLQLRVPHHPALAHLAFAHLELGLHHGQDFAAGREKLHNFGEHQGQGNEGQVQGDQVDGLRDGLPGRRRMFSRSSAITRGSPLRLASNWP